MGIVIALLVIIILILLIGRENFVRMIEEIFKGIGWLSGQAVGYILFFIIFVILMYILMYYVIGPIIVVLIKFFGSLHFHLPSFLTSP